MKGLACVLMVVPKNLNSPSISLEVENQCWSPYFYSGVSALFQQRQFICMKNEKFPWFVAAFYHYNTR